MKSCAGCSGTTVSTVGDAEQRDLGAVEVLLDDHPSASGGVGEGDVTVVGDDDALARSQPVVLDDVGRAERVERGGGLLGGVADVRRPGGYAGLGHHVLGEGLAALELGGGLRRAEAVDAGVAYGVGDPGDQRRLGPDDDQVGTPGRGERGDRGAGRRASTVRLVAMCAVPALPGAQARPVTSGSAASERQRACSRAPAPITRTFTPRRLTRGTPSDLSVDLERCVAPYGVLAQPSLKIAEMAGASAAQDGARLHDPGDVLEQA